MTQAALRQRRRNLQRTRTRSDRESAIIKRLIRQPCFDDEERPSLRVLARQLGVAPSYVWKVQRKAHSEGIDTLLKDGRRITLDDLAEARRFTDKVRDVEPGVLAPAPARCLNEGDTTLIESRAMTADESIAERWREAREWKRKNLSRDRGRRVLFTVPVQ
jgi:hypothetical protein